MSKFLNSILLTIFAISMVACGGNGSGGDIDVVSCAPLFAGPLPAFAKVSGQTILIEDDAGEIQRISQTGFLIDPDSPTNFMNISLTSSKLAAAIDSATPESQICGMDDLTLTSGWTSLVTTQSATLYAQYGDKTTGAVTDKTDSGTAELFWYIDGISGKIVLTIGDITLYSTAGGTLTDTVEIYVEDRNGI